MPQPAVSRILSSRRRGRRRETIIPLVPPSLAGSSDLPGSFGRAVRRARVQARVTLPYLVLLRAGFCLPSALQQTRCALTAPFHPYPTFAPAGKGGRYIFCATILQVTLTGRYPAHCPAEFGLSSPVAKGFSPFSQGTPPKGAVPSFSQRRSSDRLRHTSVTQKGSGLKSSALPVRLLPYRVLLELLVEVASRRADHLGRLRDVPAVLAQLLHEIRALGGFLELRAACPHRRPAGAGRGAGRGRGSGPR